VTAKILDALPKAAELTKEILPRLEE